MVKNSILYPKPTKAQIEMQKIKEVLKDYANCVTVQDIIKVSRLNKKRK